MNTTRMLGLSAALLLFLAACGESAEDAAAPATEEGAATSEGETGTEEKTTQ